MQLTETQTQSIKVLVHELADELRMWDEPQGFDYWVAWGDDTDINLHNWEGTGLQCNVYAVNNGIINTSEWVDIPMNQQEK